jgi:hypothetical protein
MAIGLVRLMNFINGLSFEVDCSRSARNEEPSSRGALNSGLASGDSGLQLNLEIALSGASAKVKPLARLFRTGRKYVETSDDVTNNDFTSTLDSRIWDFSLMRLGTAKTAGIGVYRAHSSAKRLRVD